MKNIQNLLFSVVVLLFVSAGANAQLKMPSPSPDAEVMQMVGVTKVKVAYSSPGVKGRKIWGGLQKFGKVWRAGAGAATKVSFSSDVKVNGADVKKGKYTLMLELKDENNWEWIFATKGSIFGFDEKDVVLRTQAKVTKGLANKERLAYGISADTDNKGTVNLRWEKINASFEVVANTQKELIANARKFSRQANWFSLGSGSFQVALAANNEKDFKLAESMANASVAMQENTLTVAWKAVVLAKMGKKAEAKKLAEKVKVLYKESKRFRGYYDNNIKPVLDKAM